jgi:hypothetical protein
VSDLFKRAKGLFGRGEPAEPPVKASARKPVNPWHAVTIATGPRACAAARALGDRRFLSRDAPVLPLKDCDSAECTCRYEHFEDRRKGPRRAREMGVAIDGYEDAEKRGQGKRGRRTSDT